ncbi:MAG: DUF2971 domain-containing protein [Alphaproteobacteria bacterium]|nr:DUF2971 domain-containing protein [Alphaproteobacteria bacterium]
MYRFRSTEKLLSQPFQELENQEIYFASPEELNDPVEGFKNLFWHGDDIVWKNLIKHYIFCLTHICKIYFTVGTDVEIASNKIPVFANIPEESDEIFNEIILLFFESSIAASWPNSLALSKNPISRYELSTYLMGIHAYALKTIFTILVKHKIISDWPPSTDKLRTMQPQDIVGLGINQLKSDSDFCQLIEHWYAFDDLIKFHNTQETTINITALNNRRFVFGRYPFIYLTELEKIVHGNWYTATFADNPHNASMWGHYADSHRGVCLRFKTNSRNSQPTLTLSCVTGTEVNKKRFRHTWSDTELNFHQIKYTESYPEINFFKSLGVLPGLTVSGTWLFDDKRKSAHAQTYFDEGDDWRKDYWRTRTLLLSTKLADWAYEKEHRLILMPQMLDLSGVSERKLKYQFNSLEAVIFGLRTTEKDKLEIIKIIEKKCQKEKRQEFKFYQAFYSEKKGIIDTFEIPVRFDLL